MIKRQVDHGIHALRSVAQALKILYVAAMNFGSGRFQLLFAGIAARQTANFMPRFDQFLNSPVPMNPVAPVTKMRMISNLPDSSSMIVRSK